MSKQRSTFRSVGGKSVLNDIRQQIYDSIACGELYPGVALPSEKDLIKQFGVSRPALREAIQLLVGEGLLEVLQGKGIFVRKPSLDNAIRQHLLGIFLQETYLADLLRVREILEPHAAAAFVENASDEDLAELEAILEQTVQGEQEKNLFKSFHGKILRVAGNVPLERILNLIYETIQMRRDKLSGIPEDIEAHRRLLLALKQRDPELAKAAMKDHVELLYLHSWVRLSRDKEE